VLSPRMSHILEDLAGDSRPLDDSPARSKAWLGKTRGCITTCWQLRSPTSSLDRLGNSQQRARVRMYEGLCGGARCLTLTYPQVGSKKRPAGTNKKQLHPDKVHCTKIPLFDHLIGGGEYGEGNSAASIRPLTNKYACIRPAKTGSLSVCFSAEPAIWKLCVLITAAAFHMVNSSMPRDSGSKCKFALDRTTKRHCETIGK
jgi:hypothetical protein